LTFRAGILARKVSDHVIPVQISGEFLWRIRRIGRRITHVPRCLLAPAGVRAGAEAGTIMSPAKTTPAPSTLAAPWPCAHEKRALIMGIVNITPDSFSDGGRFDTIEAALSHAGKLVREGADLLDIGGESTRPGAAEVPATEEIARVVPAIRALRDAHPDLSLSVDTYKAETARAALIAGARIVNDVWGLQRDPGMADLVGEAGAGLVIMHNRHERLPGIDIVSDMMRFFETSLALADKAVIPRARIALDPGIGFGKTLEQNLAAIRAIPKLRAEFGTAILLGVSRKSFLGLITGREVDDRLAGTLATGCFGLLGGADILRVHDVAAHRDAACVIAALAAPQS